MTVSYTLTTLLAVLLIELVVGALLWLGLTYGSFVDNTFSNGARQSAKLFALAAAVQAGDGELDPATTFDPGHPASIDLPGVLPDPNNPAQAPYSLPDPGSPNAPLVLLITPGQQILASSNTASFTPGMSLAALPEAKNELVTRALAGQSGVIVERNEQGRVVSVAQTVWNRRQKAIGAIYFQIPELSGPALLGGFSKIGLGISLLWLFVTLPVALFFGMLTTRGLIRRLRRLVGATVRFAGGDYTERVTISRRDEVGQLERHFNMMAEQLVESMAQRQRLSAQNAQILERNRIARDLHDSVKQQIFAISMQIGTALSLLEVTPALVMPHLKAADDLTYQAQQELTGLIHQLRPVPLQEKGLAAALEDYLASWQAQSSIEVQRELRPATGWILPLEVEEALWRVAQEALSNVARHSQATTVRVALSCEGGINAHSVLLEIEDNGCGFKVAERDTVGVGLHSMQERLKGIGGQLTIKSKSGEGTLIRAEYSPVHTLK